MKYNTFYFEAFDFDKKTLKASFLYSFDSKLFFEEEIHFFDKNFDLRGDINLKIIENILFHIHIAIGISYYKFYPTKDLIIKTGFVNKNQIDFWKKFYLNGLGEFFYKNKINPSKLLNFSFISKKEYKKIDFLTSDKILLPIGGGKDSIVSIELLRSIGKKIDLITISKNDNILYKYTEEKSHFKRFVIKRDLSLNIKEIIETGAYNGHVPITGIFAFVMLLISYLYDYKYIIISNEKSANYGNTNYYGFEINHQWSKSFDFELSFKNYTNNYITNNIHYFSLLRGFYEIKIAKIFTKLCKGYFGFFSSCNKNFKIFNKKETNKKLWCNSCPKCLFVYTILRPYLNQKQILKIFGKELYFDKSLEKLYKELLQIDGIKPFECVGTNEEIVFAMKKTIKKFRKKTPYILELFIKKVDKNMTELDYKKLEKKLFKSYYKETLIPKDILDNIKIIL